MHLRRRFLNRLLGLPVARQNLLFNYFACTLAAEIRAAKADGRYYEGVSDLGGSHVSKVEPQVLLRPLATPLPSTILPFHCSQGPYEQWTGMSCEGTSTASTVRRTVCHIVTA